MRGAAPWRSGAASLWWRVPILLTLALTIPAFYADMLRGITVDKAAMRQAAAEGFATATDLADYLVKKGLPFRDAHEVVAHAVKTAIGLGQDLSELPLATLQGFDARIEADVAEALTLSGSLNARNTLGGTAPAQVRLQIERHQARLA